MDRPAIGPVSCNVNVDDSDLRKVPWSPLWVILAAGEWKSPAFLAYIDQHRLETDMVISAHVDESDGE